MSIPPLLLSHLREIEPSASFSSRPPRIVSSSGRVYYGKTGSPSEAEQFAGEAACLNTFAQASPGLAPNVLAHGVDPTSGKCYTISDYLDIQSGLTNASKSVLAKRLALEVHGYTSEKGYGFDVPTYCGVTRFENKWCETWAEAYGGMIGSLLDRIEAQGTDNELVKMGRKVQTRVIPYLLGEERLSIKPSFLHGDLWSGNVGTLSDDVPVVYDPSSYFGHNEADQAIARIFGGFGPSFFTEYHSHRPKSEPVDEYEERMILYELFHYLNHTLMFGSGYAGQSKGHMRKLLKFADSKGI